MMRTAALLLIVAQATAAPAVTPAHLLAGMQYVLGDLEADDTPTAPLKK